MTCSTPKEAYSPPKISPNSELTRVEFFFSLLFYLFCSFCACLLRSPRLGNETSVLPDIFLLLKRTLGRDIYCFLWLSQRAREKSCSRSPHYKAFFHIGSLLFFKGWEIKEPAALEQEVCCTSKGQVGLRQPLLPALLYTHCRLKCTSQTGCSHGSDGGPGVWGERKRGEAGKQQNAASPRAGIS